MKTTGPKESSSLTRRSFGKRSVGAAAGAVLFPDIFLKADGISPNSKLNIACVGVGGKGKSDVAAAADGNNIVALCDVDDRRARGSFKSFPDAKRFKDYRVMLDKMGKEIDAVTVTTPDHMHFPVAMLAMEMGKHVCVQKPLTNTIWEARQLLKASRKYKVVTQMGIQGHTNNGMRRLKEWIDAGAIGKVKEIVYWTNRPIWPQHHELKFPKQPVPSELDWDLWQGTAQERSYNEGILPKNWRAFWEYGAGALGDIGCHAMDAGFWSLDLGAPDWAEASTSPITRDLAPASTHLTYQFPAKGIRGPIKVTWMDGGLMPPKPKELESSRQLNSEWGQLFLGDAGAIYVSDAYCATPRIIPESRMQEFKLPEKTIPRSPTPGEPQKEWTHCIKNNKTPGANFEYAVPLTEMVLMGNLAIRSQRRVEWDGAAMKVTNIPEANKFVKRDYRQGWEPRELA